MDKITEILTTIFVSTHKKKKKIVYHEQVDLLTTTKVPTETVSESVHDEYTNPKGEVSETVSITKIPSEHPIPIETEVSITEKMTSHPKPKTEDTLSS